MDSILMDLGVIDYDTRIELMNRAKDNYGVFDIVGRTLIKDAFGEVMTHDVMVYDQMDFTLRLITTQEYCNAKFYKHVVILDADKDNNCVKYHILTNVEMVDKYLVASKQYFKDVISSVDVFGNNTINYGELFTFEASKTVGSAYEAMKYIQSGIADTVLSYSNEDNDIRDELDSLLNSKLSQTNSIGEFDMPGM